MIVRRIIACSLSMSFCLTMMELLSSLYAITNIIEVCQLPEILGWTILLEITFFFLDSDDELSTDAISSLVSLVVKYNNVDIVYGDWYTSRRHDSLQNRQEIKELVNDRKQICNLLLSMKISMTGVNKLIQRKYLQRNSLYFREGILHEDNLFTYYLAISARRIAISHTPSYVYFNNPGSITNSVSTKHAESCLEIASQILDDKNDFMNRQKISILQVFN
jgi:hypothetical protein